MNSRADGVDVARVVDVAARSPSTQRQQRRVGPGRRWRLLPLAGLVLALSACLEVEQHPAWRQGQYDGKPDPLPQTAHFANDRLSWNAAIVNRNQRQNEYNRMP